MQRFQGCVHQVFPNYREVFVTNNMQYKGERSSPMGKGKGKGQDRGMSPPARTQADYGGKGYNPNRYAEVRGTSLARHVSLRGPPISGPGKGQIGSAGGSHAASRACSKKR